MSGDVNNRFYSFLETNIPHVSASVTNAIKVLVSQGSGAVIASKHYLFIANKWFKNMVG